MSATPSATSAHHDIVIIYHIEKFHAMHGGSTLQSIEAKIASIDVDPPSPPPPNSYSISLSKATPPKIILKASAHGTPTFTVKFKLDYQQREDFALVGVALADLGSTAPGADNRFFTEAKFAVPSTLGQNSDPSVRLEGTATSSGKINYSYQLFVKQLAEGDDQNKVGTIDPDLEAEVLP